jgi:hypothetical protein
MTAHKAMVQYAERIMVDDKDSFETLGNCIQSLRSIFLEGSTDI